MPDLEICGGRCDALSSLRKNKEQVCTSSEIVFWWHADIHIDSFVGELVESGHQVCGSGTLLQATSIFGPVIKSRLASSNKVTGRYMSLARGGREGVIGRGDMALPPASARCL